MLISFLQSYSSEHSAAMTKLKSLVGLASAGEQALQKVTEDAEFLELKNSKTPIAMTVYAFRLLFLFLLDGKHLLLLAVINSHIDIKVVAASAGDVEGVLGTELHHFESSGNQKPLVWSRAAAEEGAAKRKREESESASNTAGPNANSNNAVPRPMSLPQSVVEVGLSVCVSVSVCLCVNECMCWFVSFCCCSRY